MNNWLYINKFRININILNKEPAKKSSVKPPCVIMVNSLLGKEFKTCPL